MRLKARRLLPWLLAGVVVAVVAFLVGCGSVADESAPSPAATAGPHGLSVPKLRPVAALPPLRQPPVTEEEPSGEPTPYEPTSSSEEESYVPAEEESYVPAEESTPQATEEPSPPAASESPSPSTGGGGEGGDLEPQT